MNRTDPLGECAVALPLIWPAVEGLGAAAGEVIGSLAAGGLITVVADSFGRPRVPEFAPLGLSTINAVPDIVCMSKLRGMGQRNWQHESDKPYKGWRVDPKNPNRIRGKDENGKDVVKPRPSDFPGPKDQRKGD